MARFISTWTLHYYSDKWPNIHKPSKLKSLSLTMQNFRNLLSHGANYHQKTSDGSTMSLQYLLDSETFVKLIYIQIKSLGHLSRK